MSSIYVHTRSSIRYEIRALLQCNAFISNRVRIIHVHVYAYRPCVNNSNGILIFSLNLS